MPSFKRTRTCPCLTKRMPSKQGFAAGQDFARGSGRAYNEFNPNLSKEQKTKRDAKLIRTIFEDAVTHGMDTRALRAKYEKKAQKIRNRRGLATLFASTRFGSTVHATSRQKESQSALTQFEAVLADALNRGRPVQTSA